MAMIELHLLNSCGSLGTFENNNKFSEFDSTDYFLDSDLRPVQQQLHSIPLG
jgi:hypothetical protein